ncbi:DUF1223 domain-containing protein [Novosphingobium lentum]|uniref:DUF1223 domain-containing protein n=1 Tax=Novosphingobium lentum TaxID=145287 RepID=UPI00082DC673|nr:DUF1223 domain-containing protein [Novosphingobium lentum]
MPRPQLTAAIILPAVLLQACSPSRADPAPPGAGPGVVSADGAHRPVVVELFQSQGCSSCPPANANVNAIAGRADILALSFSVTYWDYLGWKDSFAQPDFTQRQRDYAASHASNGVYTPQVVIDGQRALVGSNAAQLAAAIRETGPVAAGPSIERQGGALVIGAGQTAQPLKVLVVTYDPRVRDVPIRAGENSGRTLPHRNIVTDLHEAGRWTGKPLQLAFTNPRDPALRTAVLLQRGTGGAIVAARKF